MNYLTILAAESDNLTGPEAAVSIAGLVAFCFVMWLLFRGLW